MAKALDQLIWMMLHAVVQRPHCLLVHTTVTLLIAPMLRMLELDATHVRQGIEQMCKFCNTHPIIIIYSQC